MVYVFIYLYIDISFGSIQTAITRIYHKTNIDYEIPTIIVAMESGTH